MKNVVKKILSSKLLIKVGLSLHNLGVCMSIPHPMWLFKIRKIPVLAVTQNKAKEITDQDVHLCQRLITAYHRACTDSDQVKKSTSELWSSVIDKNYGKLASLLEMRDATQTAMELSSLFGKSFITGIASGDVLSHSNGKVGAAIWSTNYQSNVVALAEYLGLVRAESSEQGEVSYGLRGGLDSIVANIEKQLNISMDFPDVGAPYGIRANNSLITIEHPEHIYVALRINHAIQNYLNYEAEKKHNLMEIGGGVGSLAYWLIKLEKTPVGKYSIVDLPLINVLQGYFLSKALGISKVKLYDEANDDETLVTVNPTFSINSMNQKEIDIIINQNSMPEMSEQSVENYILFMKKHLSGIFFSYNHEAYALVNETPQILVPEIVDHVSGFKRLSRTRSWIRRSYVEEIYKRLD